MSKMIIGADRDVGKLRKQEREGLWGAMDQGVIKVLLVLTFLIFFVTMGLCIFWGRNSDGSTSSSYLEDGTALQSDTIRMPQPPADDKANGAGRLAPYER